MNTTVTATGMQVIAKSDQTFMLIKAGHAANAAAVQSSKKISDTALVANSTLLPVAHSNIANISAADTPANWYYKTSDDPELYGGSGHESAPTALTELNGYVLVNEFSLSIAEGGNDMENIKVGKCTITAEGKSAVKVLVATSTAVEEFGETGDGSTVLASSLTDESVVYVKIYIYWDGADEDVYTNGIADLKNTSVTLTFTGNIVTE